MYDFIYRCYVCFRIGFKLQVMGNSWHVDGSGISKRVALEFEDIICSGPPLRQSPDPLTALLLPPFSSSPS